VYVYAKFMFVLCAKVLGQTSKFVHMLFGFSFVAFNIWLVGLFYLFCTTFILLIYKHKLH